MARAIAFFGVTVPELRRLARLYQNLPLRDVVRLLKSGWHEERQLALLILVRQDQRANPAQRDTIYNLYLRNTRHINNWDLVDCSAGPIVGAHLEAGGRQPLRRLAKSPSVWERRIAMLSTFHYIKKGEYDAALVIATILVGDRHEISYRRPLAGMLREIGNRDRLVEERFLRAHADGMPRTMLRYAIERFPERVRLRYLAR